MAISRFAVEIGDILYKWEKFRVSVPASKISSVTQTATDLQKGNKIVNFPGKDTSKPMTEPNSSQIEFDVVKGLKVDEKWISFDRRKGNKEWNYAEAVTGNIVLGGKNIISGESQFNTSSNLRDNPTVEVSSKGENKVEENFLQSTINGSQMKEIGGNVRDQI